MYKNVVFLFIGIIFCICFIIELLIFKKIKIKFLGCKEFMKLIMKMCVEKGFVV